tara:strand:- start:936 stop:2300 length:1365 start_codon:yes stop_codon:yes gene_type:complete
MVSLPSPLRPVLAFLTLALSLHAQVSTEWDQSKSYDRGVVVIHSEELYLAHTQVPSGVELTNDLYWQKLEDEDPDSPPNDLPSSAPSTGTEQPAETPLPNGLINFSWGFKTIEEHDAETYLTESNMVKKFIDPEDALISYWGPSENGVVANLTYRFDFNGTLKSARARIATTSLNYSSNSNYSGSGFSSLWASKDGSEWSRISNNPTPSGESALVVFDEQLPDSLMDGSQLFLKIQLQSSDTPTDSYATARFSSASLNEVEDVFHLDANYSATTDDPGRTNYNLGVNEGIAYVLANLETYNLYSEAQYGSSVLSAIEQGKLMVTQSPGEYELIGLSDFNQTMKQRVQENSFELGFSYLNELITDPATSSATKDNGIRWGITWTDDENASSATPYTPGWLYLEQLGWVWTNASAFPYFYQAPSTTQEGSWMFFEEGSAPPRFYHFQTQSWMTIVE